MKEVLLKIIVGCVCKLCRDWHDLVSDSLHIASMWPQDQWHSRMHQSFDVLLFAFSAGCDDSVFFPLPPTEAAPKIESRATANGSPSVSVPG